MFLALKMAEIQLFLSFSVSPDYGGKSAADFWRVIVTCISASPRLVRILSTKASQLFETCEPDVLTHGLTEY